MLENLVGCRFGPTTIHVRGTRLLLECSSILANIGPPNVIEGARAETVYTFAVVRSNDGIGESSTVLEEENSIRISSLGLLRASAGCKIGRSEVAG